MALTEKQVPFTGPYDLDPKSPAKSKGPTAEALKRAMSRLGHIEWRDFDQHYNQPLEQALDKWDPGKNGYGQGRWNKIREAKITVGPHAGEYALDRYARTLIQNEAGQAADSTDLEKWQGFFTEFFRIAIRNAGAWDYNSNIRPVHVDVNPANPTGTSDCSASGIQGAYYAMKKAGLVGNVQDPSKQNWSGYGNTDLYEDDWPKTGAPYRVGDIAHFHSSRHVCWCIKPGDHRAAEWWTFGHEPPAIVTLATYPRFPSEFMFVVRPEYLP